MHAAPQPNILTCCHRYLTRQVGQGGGVAHLRPNCSCRGLHVSNSVFPVNWSSLVDLELQQEIRVVQLKTPSVWVSWSRLHPHSWYTQLSSQQRTHLRCWACECATISPVCTFEVDMVGMAESVHPLLTKSRMKLSKDAEGWMVERFRGDEARCSHRLIKA